MTDEERFKESIEEAIEDLEAPADLQEKLRGGTCYNPTCQNGDTSVTGVCIDPTCRSTTAGCGGGDSTVIIVQERLR